MRSESFFFFTIEDKNMSQTSMSIATQLIPKEEAQLRADAAYKKLCELWFESFEAASKGDSNFVWNDFWKAGNILDCIISYFAVRQPTKIPVDKSPAAFIELGLNLFNRKHYPSTDPYHWRDDYGWWGNALANAYKYRGKLQISSDLAERCKVAAIECGWQPLFASAKDNENFTPTKCTRVKGFGEGFAAWNDESAHLYEFDPAKNDCRDNPETNYSNVPNTVTNAGFMALSSVIYEHLDVSVEREQYLACLRKSFDWFQSFFKDDQLLNNLDLVRETVNPDVHKAWCKGNIGADAGVRSRAWSADQGVFLYVLLNTLRHEPDDKNIQRSEQIKTVINRIATSFVKQKNEMILNGVLREFPFDPQQPRPDNSNCVNFNCNYCTGPGVFMRYIGFILADPKLSDEIEKITPGIGSALRELILESGKQAWDNKGWNGDDDQFCLWYQKGLTHTSYEHWYNTYDRWAPKELWHIALQTAALDLLVAYLRLYP
jgi:hypothetical protein